MATQRQIEANRRNAKKSTGPKSAAGKMRAGRNARKHGLTAKPVFEPVGEEVIRRLEVISGNGKIYGWPMLLQKTNRRALELAVAELWLEAARLAETRAIRNMASGMERQPKPPKRLNRDEAIARIARISGKSYEWIEADIRYRALIQLAQKYPAGIDEDTDPASASLPKPVNDNDPPAPLLPLARRYRRAAERSRDQAFDRWQASKRVVKDEVGSVFDTGYRDLMERAAEGLPLNREEAARLRAEAERVASERAEAERIARERQARRRAGLPGDDEIYE